MRTYIMIAIMMSLLTGCDALVSPEPRLPQLNEHAITSPDHHGTPKWSSDGKYIAFLDYDSQTLETYDVQTRRFRTVATGLYDAYFEWTPQGELSYMNFRESPSGYTFPKIYDLHVVSLADGNDRIVMSNLASPMGYAWLADNQSIVASLGTASSHDYYTDVYLVDIAAGTTRQLVSRQTLDIEFPSALSLASDQRSLAIYGIRRVNGENQSVIILYDIPSRSVIKEISVSQIDPQLSLLDDGLRWVNGKRWILVYGGTTTDKCAPVALYFFNVDAPSDNFCIPVANGTIHAPDLSPDLSQLVFLAPVRPQVDYVMIADLMSEYRLRLK